MKTTKWTLRPEPVHVETVQGPRRRGQPFPPTMNPFLAFVLPFFAAVHRHGFSFHFGWSVQPVLALLAGVLILVRPKLLNLIVAVYLIVVGLVGLFHFL